MGSLGRVDSGVSQLLRCNQGASSYTYLALAGFIGVAGIASFDGLGVSTSEVVTGSTTASVLPAMGSSALAANMDRVATYPAAIGETVFEDWCEANGLGEVCASSCQVIENGNQAIAYCEPGAIPSGTLPSDSWVEDVDLGEPRGPELGQSQDAPHPDSVSPSTLDLPGGTQGSVPSTENTARFQDNGLPRGCGSRTASQCRRFFEVNGVEWPGTASAIPSTENSPRSRNGEPANGPDHLVNDLVAEVLNAGEDTPSGLVPSTSAASTPRTENSAPEAAPVADAEPVAAPEAPVADAEPVAAAEPVADAEPVAAAEPVADAEPVAAAEPVADAEPVDLPEAPVADADVDSISTLTDRELAFERGAIHDELYDIVQYVAAGDIEALIGAPYSHSAVQRAMRDGGPLASAQDLLEPLFERDELLSATQTARADALTTANLVGRPSDATLEALALNDVADMQPVLSGYTDEDLELARQWPRELFEELASGDVELGADTLQVIENLVSVDRAIAEELVSRGHQVVAPAVEPEEGLLFAAALIEEAYKHKDKPYVSDADGPNAFDCSGLTTWVYEKALGVSMDSYSATQLDSQTEVALSDIRPGDIVGRYPKNGKVGHVAIYLGGDAYFHAASSNLGILRSENLAARINEGGYTKAIRPWADENGDVREGAELTEDFKLGPGIESEEDLAAAVYMNIDAVRPETPQSEG